MKQRILDVTVLAVLATALWHAVHPNVGIAVALVAGAVALAGRKSAEVPVSAVPVEEPATDGKFGVLPSVAETGVDYDIYWGDDD